MGSVQKGGVPRRATNEKKKANRARTWAAAQKRKEAERANHPNRTSGQAQHFAPTLMGDFARAVTEVRRRFGFINDNEKQKVENPDG